MPRAPRRRRIPGPNLPPIPRLSLSPIRSAGSVELDRDLEDRGAIIPFLRWDDFLRRVRFDQGEHITIVGTTGSGKTVLARELLARRDFVAVLGTKNVDVELYKPFEQRGYEITTKFDAEPDLDESRVIFRPGLSSPDDKGIERQSKAFKGMLTEVFEAGGWTVYADEIWYMTNKLKLGTTFEVFWTAGRSMNITLVVATQLPVHIPLLAFDQATHLFLFRNSDRRRIDRMAEFAGADRELVRQLIPRLPKHEFLYADTREGTLYRSKVIVR